MLKPKCWLIDVLISEATLPLSIVPTWTQIFPSVKTARNRNIPLFSAIFMEKNDQNAIPLTNLNITMIWLDAVRLILGSTPLDLKSLEISYICTCSNMSSAKTSIR